MAGRSLSPTSRLRSQPASLLLAGCGSESTAAHPGGAIVNKGGYFNADAVLTRLPRGRQPSHGHRGDQR